MFMYRVVLSMVVLWFATVGFAADKFVANEVHTNIGFTVKHMVITTVPGKFQDYDIELMFDEKDISKT